MVICNFSSFQTFDELLSLAEKGDHRNVDTLIKDIDGGELTQMGLTGDDIASSFGKATRPDMGNPKFVDC